ncbi:MAG: hypothetical protein OEW35_00485 [Gammaproteobacteria bacterium]|nr:hypothetical protein [Gammaproteobacteria bacterium]MDH4254653.1 hypothetical protein [Gammaproteobacteria bacterium]MDH5308336.1 hypothetical protein [Gammaproteobacteria bacterium]
MIDKPATPGERLADTLNRDCHCIDVDSAALLERLAAHLGGSGIAGSPLELRGYPFAASPVFVWRGHVDAMARFVTTFESVVADERVRERLLDSAPAVARSDFGTRGVFFAYDFHLGPGSPQLIEINTNAGGVLLNLYLAAAQQACCAEVDSFFGGQTDFDAVEREIVGMFREEWHLQRGEQALETIAIVDVAPETQPLYAEFVLFRAMFRRSGLDALIVDRNNLEFSNGALRAGGRRIDLVYNRLTDFYLQEPESAALRAAYESGAVVLTPAPRHYALFADKRSLPLFSDAAALRALGIDGERIAVLNAYLPAATRVTRDDAERLWANRKKLFFKPATGYGSRGTYRGAKLTRRVWEEILNSDYIAQAEVPPGERRIRIDGEYRSLKVDIRCITYRGRIQQLSARLYQGQTTNLRTAGGGLATVFATPALADFAGDPG